MSGCQKAFDGPDRSLILAT